MCVVEWAVAGESLKDDAAKRIQITARVSLVSLHLFWRQVARRADHQARACEVTFSLGHFSDAEISEICVILPGNIAHQHVGRLDIPVQETGLMDRVERHGQLCSDAHRPLGVQSLLAIKDGPQLQAINPLHGQIEAAGVLADPEH